MDRNYILGVRLREASAPNSYLRDLPVVRYLTAVDMLKFDTPVTFADYKQFLDDPERMMTYLLEE